MTMLASMTENGVHMAEIRIEPQELPGVPVDAYLENTGKIVGSGFASGHESEEVMAQVGEHPSGSGFSGTRPGR